ncbi:lysozyme inhibitor LprI family protein [Phenylobacterium sp.]|uniref:lysozyme inhibitor LprI family protein n=1 Tax=Phenylobacterium sp. TaxID=1871053 RepID=UPI002C0D6966|nr:lysozyme inhibitor LprI family protein [Phenylobacterium sp.]HVI32696.1 lysozyme inhibitor LprI family protein [Phenylobacterium sp.]
MSDAPHDPSLLDRLEEPPRRRLGPGLAAGVLIALTASGGLAWWLASDHADAPANVSVQHAAKAREGGPAAPILADAGADETQVRRAYEQFQVIYADLGPDGLERFSQDCAGALAQDPRILDYCLAFDTFARAVAADSPWFGNAELRHLDLARQALPSGADPAQRLVQVRHLTRTATGAPEPVVIAKAPDAPPIVVAQAPVPPPAVARTEPATVPARPSPPPPLRAAAPARTPAAAPARVERVVARAAPAERPKLQKASAPARKARPARKALAPIGGPALGRCLAEPTPAERALCLNPDLRTADQRMREAYDKALAAGADRQALDREQAEWRTARNMAAHSKDAVAKLYDQRIEQLTARTEDPPF